MMTAHARAVERLARVAALHRAVHVLNKLERAISSETVRKHDLDVIRAHRAAHPQPHPTPQDRTRATIDAVAALERRTVNDLIGYIEAVIDHENDAMVPELADAARQLRPPENQ